MAGPTIVSCLFDLASREPAPGRRSVDEYLRWGKLLLELDADLICFADPAVAPAVTAGRRDAGLAERTQVVAIPFEATAHAHRLGAVERLRGRRPLRNGNPSKDTARYAIVGWTKLDLVAQAIAANPFGAEHFIWCDFGVARAAITAHHAADRVFSEPADHVRLLQMRPLDPGLADDRDRHLSYLWGHFAAALISGPAAGLQAMVEVFGQEMEQALEDGYAPSDEQLLELVVLRRPELFRFYHGDYDHVLENYRRPRGSADNLTFQLRCWRSRQEWGPAAELAGGVVRSIGDGVFAGGGAEVARLLDESFLALYYARPDDPSAAIAAAELLRDRAHSDPGARDEFLRHELRMRRNLAFAGVEV